MDSVGNVEKGRTGNGLTWIPAVNMENRENDTRMVFRVSWCASVGGSVGNDVGDGVGVAGC